MNPLLARITADALVVVHLGFVGFVVLGAFPAWRWHRLIWIHLPAALWGALIEFSGWLCPLTPLEKHFRRLAGESQYQGGFIEHYLIRVLYPVDYTLALRVTLGLLVVALNAFAYGVYVRRWMGRQSDGTAAPGRSLFDRLIELEFTGPIAFAALAVVFVGCRIPWLDLGYGTRPDAWRVALTANYLWANGEYLPSRLPGYPLHEFVTAALIKGGWIWTNLSTVLISLIGVYLFARIARKLELPNRGVLTIAFAFAPLLWIYSVMTMENMWALTFLLGAYLAVLSGSPVRAGLSLGVAVGFRHTSLAMLMPLSLLLLRSGRPRAILPLTITAAAVVLLAFAPVIAHYRLHFLNFYDQPVPVQEVIRRLAKDGLGIIGTLTLLAALVLSFQRLRQLPRDLRRDPNVLTWAVAIVVYAIVYIRLPHEVAYLIPVFPFGFFFLARYLSRVVLVGVLTVFVLAGFIDVVSLDKAEGLHARTFTSARIGKGMLLSDIETLHNQRNFARELRQLTTTNPDLQKPAIVVVGFIYPELAVLYKDELSIGILEEDLGAISQLSDKGVAEDRRNGIDYVWLLDYADFQKFKDEGLHIYYTADAARSIYGLYAYRPGYFGAIELPLSRENPSLGGGTASTNR